MAKNISFLQSEKQVESFVDFIKRANDIGVNVIEALIFSGVFNEFGINKKTLIQNISNIQSYASFQNRSEFKYVEYKEYDFEFLQNKEKELLGVNFEYHPIHGYQEIIKNKKYQLISEALINPQRNLSFVAVISKIKIHKTKTGEDMAFIQCEDEFNSIDGVVFPDVFKKFRIETGKVYLVHGKLDYKKQKQSILIDDIKIIKE
jgi:DNA polymerase-3 subunit alpha